MTEKNTKRFIIMTMKITIMNERRMQGVQMYSGVAWQQ